MRPVTRDWAGRLGAVLAGATASLAFPAANWWWMGWVGLVPVLVVIARSPTRRESLFRSWLAGAGFLTALHYWLIPNMGLFTPIVSAFVGLFWLPLGLAVWTYLGPDASGAKRWSALAVVPATWVLIEWARSWEYLGGTWGLWGLSLWQSNAILQSAALGGVWLLSFSTVAVNAAAASVVLAPAARRERLASLGVAVAMPLVMVFGGLLRGEPPVTGSFRVAGIQPGVFDDIRDRIDAHVELTESLDPGSFEVVVWGQSSVGLDPAGHPEVDEALRAVASRVGTDVFVNVDADTGAGITKSTLQYTPQGPVASYSKRRLVPFGEYIPLRSLFGWVGEMTEAASQDRLRGRQATIMTTAGVEIGPLISYESTFSDLRRELAQMGADLSIVQGSSWTFQGTWAQPQQAAFEAVRAVESGRPAVLVAVSGTSAGFDARGRSLTWVDADRQEAFVVDVPLSQEMTPYVRYGDWVIWLCVAAIGAALIPRVLPRRLRSSSPSSLMVDTPVDAALDR